jgi:hypothetical protein
VSGRFWICEWPVPASTRNWVLAPFHKPWSPLNISVVPFGRDLPMQGWWGLFM